MFCGPLRILAQLSITIPCFLISVPLVRADEQYADELIERAHELRLADDVLWIRLLHYKPNMMSSGVHSLVDDPKFFFAKDGATNPQAELDATLRAFFSTAPSVDDEQNPQCGFPARYHWLDEKLRFDHSRMPVQPCERFQTWSAALNPGGVTLIYPAAYLNNPASMFGHTLLRLDGVDQNEQTRLLAYAANYAAGTAERSGLAFAINGIFGGYRGLFSIAPYYKLVSKYSDLENRDIWEYELDMTKDEEDQLVRHLWEVGSTYFDYYFFDENCSYHLLSWLEGVRPQLNLTDEFSLWVIPSDSVRVVADVPNLMKKAVYRPSSSTSIRERAKYLTDDENDFAVALAKGEMKPDSTELAQLEPEHRARVLELAFEYLSYLRLSGRAQGEDVPERGRVLLLERSKLSIDLPVPQVPVPTVRPDQGHRTARWSLGYGRRGDNNFAEIEWRPAYHDLLDASGGYVQGAELRFFDLAFRQFESDEVKLERFMPLSIISLSPRDRFFQPKSWRVNLGVKREPIGDSNAGTLSYLAQGGVGLTYQLAGESLWISALMEPTAKWNEGYADRYALGAGPSVTLLSHAGEGFSMLLRGASSFYFLGEEHREQEIELGLRFGLSTDTSIRARLAHTFSFDDYRNELGLSFQWYY